MAATCPALPFRPVSRFWEVRWTHPALSGVALVMVATPMAGLRAMLQASLPASTAPVAWLCKGFEAPLSGQRLARACWATKSAGGWPPICVPGS